VSYLGSTQVVKRCWLCAGTSCCVPSTAWLRASVVAQWHWHMAARKPQLASSAKDNACSQSTSVATNGMLYMSLALCRLPSEGGIAGGETWHLLTVNRAPQTQPSSRAAIDVQYYMCLVPCVLRAQLVCGAWQVAMARVGCRLG
jgi:hypothetical protein